MVAVVEKLDSGGGGLEVFEDVSITLSTPVVVS